MSAGAKDSRTEVRAHSDRREGTLHYAATRRSAIVALLGCLAAGTSSAQQLTLPNRADTLKLAVIGDSGTGDRAQREVGQRMAEFHRIFPFELVLMLGDNLYGRQRPQDYERKFAEPYRALLDAGVRFYASLGNHDQREQRYYKLFNMNGRTYYSFAPRPDVRLFALESDYIDRAQLDWLERELGESREAWKIGFFHHPMYSSGRRHGSDMTLREVLEPLFVEHGVSVVFSGHEHFYERIKPQRGITYFISGAAGRLRRGNIRKDSPLTAAGFDQDRSFMLVEIGGDELFFQAVSRTGVTVDRGVVTRRTGMSSDDRIPPPVEPSEGPVLPRSW